MNIIGELEFNFGKCKVNLGMDFFDKHGNRHQDFQIMKDGVSVCEVESTNGIVDEIVCLKCFNPYKGMLKLMAADYYKFGKLISVSQGYSASSASLSYNSFQWDV